MINDNLTEEKRVQRRIEFYRKVSEMRDEMLKSYPMQEDVDVSDDYDGGRYDFYTTRGITK